MREEEIESEATIYLVLKGLQGFWEAGLLLGILPHCRPLTLIIFLSISASGLPVPFFWVPTLNRLIPPFWGTTGIWLPLEWLPNNFEYNLIKNETWRFSCGATG